MTVPIERYNSLLMAKKFLEDLMDPKKTPKVPKYVRKEAGYRLRHFPAEYHLFELQKKAPKVLGKKHEK